MIYIEIGTGMNLKNVFLYDFILNVGMSLIFCFCFFGPCIFIIEERTDQRNAQINYFSLINLLLFNLLRHVSVT